MNSYTSNTQGQINYTGTQQQQYLTAQQYLENVAGVEDTAIGITEGIFGLMTVIVICAIIYAFKGDKKP